MKVKCIVSNVWTSTRNIKRGEIDDIPPDEAKMLAGRGQVEIIKKAKPREKH